MESWMFPGIGENFAQLEVVKSSTQIVLSVMVFSSMIKGLWLILSQKWICWKDLGQLMQCPGNLDMEVRVWAAARNVFWNDTAGLILSGPRSDSSAYVMDPADTWPSPALHHCWPWHPSVAACNCHHFHRGPSCSVLFLSLATDLVQAGVSG